MVVVDDAERADAGSGEILQDRRTEPAGANDEDPRALELLLSRPADLGQKRDELSEWFRFLATACPECGVIDDPLLSGPTR